MLDPKAKKTNLDAIKYSPELLTAAEKSVSPNDPNVQKIILHACREMESRYPDIDERSKVVAESLMNKLWLYSRIAAGVTTDTDIHDTESAIVGLVQDPSSQLRKGIDVAFENIKKIAGVDIIEANPARGYHYIHKGEPSLDYRVYLSPRTPNIGQVLETLVSQLNKHEIDFAIKFNFHVGCPHNLSRLDRINIGFKKDDFIKVVDVLNYLNKEHGEEFKKRISSAASAVMLADGMGLSAESIKSPTKELAQELYFLILEKLSEDLVPKKNTDIPRAEDASEEELLLSMATSSFAAEDDVGTALKEHLVNIYQHGGSVTDLLNTIFNT